MIHEAPGALAGKLPQVVSRESISEPVRRYAPVGITARLTD